MYVAHIEIEFLARMSCIVHITQTSLMLYRLAVIQQYITDGVDLEGEE